MNIFKSVAEELDGVTVKNVREIYETIVSQVNEGLKKDRRFRLPGLGILTIKYKPARKARKGKNPFTGEMTTFKAKPASNKLKFRPVKEMKAFVEKLAVKKGGR